MALKVVAVNVDEEDWEIFKEIHGDYQRSKRIRKLMRKDIDDFMREEIKAQSLAGLTEA